MKTIFSIVLMFMTLGTIAQKEYTVAEYIDKYKHISIVEMEKSGIPASITLAQGILESRYGNSKLAVKGNNHFGIKCHKGWTGRKMYHDDDVRNECFRVYRNPQQSYHDHTEFLQTRSRYSFLFDYSSTDYKKWAHGLKKAGYATNPKYANILIDLIHRHQLYLYDRPGRHIVAQHNHADRDEHATTQVSTQTDYKEFDNKINGQSESINNASASKEVFSFNRIKAVKVAQHDNLYTISQRYDVAQARLLKYNDLKRGEPLEFGQFIYLQPKRGRAIHRVHIVQKHESLRDISQLHGVKLSKLYQRNLLERGQEPAVGQTINLNKKNKKKPALRSKESMEDLKKKSVDKTIATNSSSELKPSKSEDKAAMDALFEKTEIAVKGAETKSAEEQEARTKATEVIRKEPFVKENEEHAEKDKKSDYDQLEPTAVPRNPEAQKETDKEASKINPVKNEISGKENVKAENPVTFVSHKVVTGDTLYNISKRYNVTVENLRQWNGLTSNNIQLGQLLKVKK